MGTAIIILDFMENYSFVLQDAAQGFYWDNSQSTVHPFSVYYMQDNVLKTLSLCCLSNCMKHDTLAVYAFQTVILKYLKTVINGLHSIVYFSDGAASQYKPTKISPI